MREPLYILNFLGRRTRTDPSPSYFRGYFVDYTPQKWAAPVAGGSFAYIDRDDRHYDLVVQHSPHHGVCLGYSSGEGADAVFDVSIGDAERLSEVIDIGSDERVPVGGFVAPARAWPVVEAFLLHPTRRPVADFMFDIEDTDWPDFPY